MNFKDTTSFAIKSSFNTNNQITLGIKQVYQNVLFKTVQNRSLTSHLEGKVLMDFIKRCKGQDIKEVIHSNADAQSSVLVKIKNSIKLTVDDNLLFESIILKDEDGYNIPAYLFLNYNYLMIINKEGEIMQFSKINNILEITHFDKTNMLYFKLKQFNLIFICNN